MAPVSSPAVYVYASSTAAAEEQVRTPRHSKRYKWDINYIPIWFPDILTTSPIFVSYTAMGSDGTALKILTTPRQYGNVPIGVITLIGVFQLIIIVQNTPLVYTLQGFPLWGGIL